MIMDVCASCYDSFAKGGIPKADQGKLSHLNGTCRDPFRHQGEQWKVRGPAEEQELGHSLILLYPIHAGWTLSHLCQLSSFQA